MSRPIRNIVVGIANLQDADPHLAAARELAERLGATLHVVHAYHLPDPVFYPYPEMSFFSHDAVERVRSSVQAQLESAVRALGADGHVTCRALPVPADLGLLEVAADVEADLLIVGATRRSGVGERLLGTTAQRVLRASATPVLIDRGGEPRRPRRILLATDLSELSARMHLSAFDLVAALAGDESPDLRFVLVVESHPSLSGELRPEALLGVAEAKLESFQNRVAPDVAVEGRVRVGSPSHEILREAEEWPADLLILGTHGRRGLSRFLIGSVAEKVLRTPPCDVLIIPMAAVDLDDELPS